MGFLNIELQGPFDDLFDLNSDGMLDPFEQACQDDYIIREMEDDASRENDDDTDIDGLGFMGKDERREALEEAGLDPDDFDEDC